jgi:glycosyltransferase involved in cell wall biosynthesis
MRGICAEVLAGRAPAERLYGIVELQRLGYRVSFDDSRFESLLAPLRVWLRRYGFFVLDLRTLVAIARHDVIVVKDDFSLLTTLIARLFGKRVIYVDAMFNLPRRRWRLVLAKWTICLSHSVIAYSQRQIDTWCEALDLPRARFRCLPYAVDTHFYRQVPGGQDSAPCVLAIGRDLGRDFDTLVQAMQGTGLRLRLITLPYLLPERARNRPDIELFQEVTYEQLFQMYADATIVVVPLKQAISYPSGIRAVFEAALLAKAIVCTHTPVLEEYLADDREVLYVPAGDVVAMRSALIALQADPQRRDRLASAARARVLAEYSVDSFAKGLAEVISAGTAIEARKPLAG